MSDRILTTRHLNRALLVLEDRPVIQATLVRTTIHTISALRVDDRSAKDGSVENATEYPVWLSPRL